MASSDSTEVPPSSLCQTPSPTIIISSIDSIEEIMASSDSTEVPPSSLCETPTIINSTKTKSKCSIRHLLSDFKAKFCVSKPKSLENHHRNAASSSATTHKNDHHGGAISLSCKMISNDLLLVDSAFAEVKEYMDLVTVKINQAREKFQELQRLGSSQRDFDELRKAVAKLKSQIPAKIRCADSKPHRNRWPNINEAEDGMAHFFHKEPKPVHTDGSKGLLEAYHDLPWDLRRCLLCFFKFPPGAIIKKSTLIYLWIGQRYTLWRRDYREEEDDGNAIFDELIAKGFIEPIYQNCSLAPDSCRMSLSVHSSLYEDAEVNGFTAKNSLDLDLGFVCGDRLGHSSLINVGEAIIDCGPQIFENMKHVQSLHLGRWHSSAMHHIELADSKILHGLNKVKSLKYPSLRGISLITELPTAILVNKLKILDLRACHNLEAIPDNIGLLRSLTHLDMSECYFLEHMPKSLAQLSNLEVLKGFLIGDFNNNKQSCTLYDLSRLTELKKLNIYVSVKDFRRLWDFDDLAKFVCLQKLTISWGGCKQSQEAASMELRRRGSLTLPPRLQKLYLRGIPVESLTNWLRPTKVKGLKKLYIRGGQLCDLGQIQERQGEEWTVEILRLKYLSDLKIDWSELRILFPKLIYLHKDECPKFTNFPCDERGVWMNKKAVDTYLQMEEFNRRRKIRGY